MPGAVLGSFEISPIRESTYWWDGGAFFGVVPKTLWSRRIAADEMNRIPAGFNCYLIRTDEHTILIETGGGAKPAFPRARYFASRGEWEHAHERLARDSVSYIDANYDPLVESGQMT